MRAVDLRGLNVRVLPDYVLGRDPYLVQRRTHRKGRTNKKWRKRYGMVTRYRHFNTVVAGDTVFMAESMYRRLKDEEKSTYSGPRDDRAVLRAGAVGARLPVLR